MNKLLKEFLSYILEDKVKTPADQAKDANYLAIGSTGYWSKTGEKPAEASTRGGKFKILNAKERAAADKELSGDTPETPQQGSSTPEQPKPLTSADITPSLSSSEPPKIQPSVGEPKTDVGSNTENLAASIKAGIVAPGNDFSRYSESVSISISKYIIENPNASDEDIAKALTELDCGSKTLTSKVTSTIPRRFSAQYKKLKDSGVFSSNCGTEYSEAQNRARFMTMIVAKVKATRMQKAVQTIGLKDVKVDAFSGDQQSLQALSKTVESATGKFYSETGVELTKEEVLDYISGFGTSKFPADTALVGKDSSGNIILVGFSDKKDLNAIINNSTVTKEMGRTKTTLDSLLSDKKITDEEHRQVTGEIEELSRQYETAEEELKDVTSSPATKLVEISETDPTKLKKLIGKAKTLSAGKNPQKYWDERIGRFQRAAGKKATEANEQEHLQWLRKAGWDGKSKVSDTMAITAFAYKCEDILTKGEEDLPKDDQEVLFRLGIVDPKEMVARVGEIRKRALGILTQTRAALDKVQVYGLPLGTFMDGIRAWKGLHLDMGDYKGTLSMVAEDNVVDYKAIEECLGGLSSLQDFASNLSISTRDIKSREYGITTGASVEVFSVTPTGEKVNVGVRNIRSKDGILGRLQTTWTYHPEFQDCLGGKRGN